MARKRVIVIGGGPAGMIAAAAAAEGGCDVLLIEKNEKLGKKLYITGKGRCNVTNTAQGDEFFANIPRNPRFLYSCVKQFSAEDLAQLLQRFGVRLKTERGGRVFPESDRASDITKALARYIEHLGVQVMLNTRVTAIEAADGAVKQVKTDRGAFECASVIIATGGASYPVTGSTGDGYRLAQSLGHGIVPVRPSLVPIETADAWLPQVQGLTLKNVELSTYINNRCVFKELGELLFAHFGITGPLALSLSSHLDEPDKAIIEIDLKPGLTAERLDDRIQRDLAEHSRRQLSNALYDLLPAAMVPVILQAAQLPPDKPANQLQKAERLRLVNALKHLPIHATGLRPIAEAVITRGGVDVKQVNPSTMESRLIRGLFFAGEVLDVDGYTGGFNLQIAFSTGYVAGRNA